MPFSTAEKLFPIVPFNLLVDTDVGLIKYISENYNDPTVFYSGLLSSPVKPLIYLLYNRTIVNPLSVVSIDKLNPKLDLYYDEFMDTKYTDIINNSITNNLFNAVKLWCNSDKAIRPTILCNSELESITISKLLDSEDSFDTVIGTYKDITIKDNDPLYFKNYSDLLQSMGKIVGKNIYIAGYKYNFIEDKDGKVTLPESSILLADRNIIKITDIYTIDDSFVPKG